MVKQMRKRLPGDRDIQARHVGEIGRPDVARVVNLREVRLTLRAVACSPLPKVSLERTKLPILKLFGIPLLNRLEDRLGLEPRLVPNQRLDLRPDFLERIAPSPPITFWFDFARHLSTLPVLPSGRQRHSSPPSRLDERHLTSKPHPQPPNIPVRFSRRHPIHPGLSQSRQDADKHARRKDLIVVF